MRVAKTAAADLPFGGCCLVVGFVMAALFFLKTDAQTRLMRLEEDLIEATKQANDGGIRVFQDGQKQWRVEPMAREERLRDIHHGFDGGPK